jgi:hypothetical protein
MTSVVQRVRIARPVAAKICALPSWSCPVTRESIADPNESNLVTGSQGAFRVLLLFILVINGPHCGKPGSLAASATNICIKSGAA